MRKGFLFLILAIGFGYAAIAQLQSPEVFLGYKVGTRYTPHWKIVSYIHHVASLAPGMVHLQQYGETNEGRPLLVAFVSSEENIRDLENIRRNNLRLANMSMDRMAAIESTPVIVWLSYNVHGNETSSSEAAMLTLYDLVDPANTKTKAWLKNTVVAIDPCINPDGRDRYVNWFNSIAGKDYNPRLDAREHREPWPGGRTNHYNFDLNRDWAWQTQVESKQRLKLYNDWLPQVHVDFHEQGVNSPYYFAPAAQPYHEVITPWQREFQVTIGKNNAKYFDQNGWLFFTKEVFDLYYPSYGDTYPLYNGAIGMTYEQGGGPAGGLGVIKREGDTLTLLDRATHHYTTSLSTIEICSANASQLVREFHKYYNDAVSKGVGDYKSFVIKTDPATAQNVAALLELLDKNKIQYGAASNGSARGFNYYSGKEEVFNTTKDDILVSAYQPKSALAKVLFEPNGVLVDSNTYDITAWSLPYVFGLKAYASKEKLGTAGAYQRAPVTSQRLEEAYGYVIPWEGLQSARVVSELLQQGIRLRFSQEPFESGGQKFGRGSILVLKTGNTAFGDGLWSQVAAACNKNQVTPKAVHSGFVDKGYDFGSSKVTYIKPPRVAMLTGEGVNSNAAGEIWFFMERELNYPVTLINANDLGRADWEHIDLLIMPDGNYRFLNNKESADQLKDWISGGGRVIALENAVGQFVRMDIGLKSKKEDTKGDANDDYAALRKYEDRDRESISSSTPGSIYKADLDNTHPLAFGYPDYYYTLKLDNNIYEFIENGGWNVGVIKKDKQTAGFVGAKLQQKLQDGLVIGVQNMGRGTITYFADDLLFRDFWQNGKLMFCNALFLVGQ